MEADFECPRCGNSLIIEDDSYSDGTQEFECDSCGAMIEVSYSISIEVDDVDITNAPPVEFECPECGESKTFDGIDEKSGSEDYECDGCEAILSGEWRDWGEHVHVEVVEKPERGEREDDEENEYENENDNEIDDYDEELL